MKKMEEGSCRSWRVQLREAVQVGEEGTVVRFHGSGGVEVSHGDDGVEVDGGVLSVGFWPGGEERVAAAVLWRGAS
jgi:hypothetical protein